MEAGGLTVEDLLNFNLGEENNKNNITQKDIFNNDPDYQQALALPEFAEEDLEWLSNKDSFPSLESCLDILTENPTVFLNHNSPVSVLDNLNIKNSDIQKNNYSSRACFMIPVRYPMKPRSNLRRRRSCFPDPPTQHFVLWGQEKGLPKPERIQHKQKRTPSLSVVMGRKCTHCQVDKTPQWRAGPTGPKTLCNACGVRYKSGRLVPEYRPANSPTFSSVLHSNSHRKVVEMRRDKQLGGVAVNEPCVYNRLAWSRERLSQNSSYLA